MTTGQRVCGALSVVWFTLYLTVVAADANMKHAFDAPTVDDLVADCHLRRSAYGGPEEWCQPANLVRAFESQQKRSRDGLAIVSVLLGVGLAVIWGGYALGRRWRKRRI